MATKLVFLHGMSIENEDDAKRYAEALSNHTQLETKSLHYGKIVLYVPRRRLLKPWEFRNNGNESDFPEIHFFELLDRYPEIQETLAENPESTEMENNALKYVADLLTEFEANKAPDSKPSEIRTADDVRTTLQEYGRGLSKDFYSFVFRYLARRYVYRSVMNGLEEQMAAWDGDSSDMYLVGHSLGSVLGLDLLKTDHGQRFRRFYSVGSPLGAVSHAPRNEVLLPYDKRVLDIPWLDISAPDDGIALRPIERSQGFEANPLENLVIHKGYPDPHAAYFFNEHARSEWMDRLLD